MVQAHREVGGNLLAVIFARQQAGSDGLDHICARLILRQAEMRQRGGRKIESL